LTGATICSATEDQALFAQLSVFAGGFTLDDAEAVCEASTCFEGVMTLRGHSLLGSDTDAATQEARFSLLESLREYAGGKTPRRPRRRAASARRAPRPALPRPRRGRTRPPPHRGEADALRRLDINSPNLRAAAAWAENADPALHARLSLALGRLLQRRGFQSEAVAPIEAGIAAANRLPTPPSSPGCSPSAPACTSTWPSPPTRAPAPPTPCPLPAARQRRR
jgi:predicted ATPase